MDIYMEIKKTLIALCCSSFLVLTACHDSNDSNDANADQPPITVEPEVQYYVSETSYDQDQLELADKINVMTYYMENVQHKKVKATAMVFFPKTVQPKDGWRIVVWEHPTVGNGDDCAPSGNKLDKMSTSIVSALLKAGYVVVAPDYEGLGEQGIHPYLNLSSAAMSAINAVKAVKQHYPQQINSAWMSVGHSQGGHASLGTAEYANSDPSYKGAVAGAPPSNLAEIISIYAPQKLQSLLDQKKRADAIQLYAEILTLSAYTGAGMQASNPLFRYLELFQPRSAKIAEYAAGSTGENGECLVPLVTRFATDITKFLLLNRNKTLFDYPGLQANFAENPELQEFFANNLPATKPISKPVMIIQGEQDELVPFELTKRMQQTMKDNGGDVIFVPVPEATHLNSILLKQSTLLEFIQQKMPAS